jgi:putative cell wall binding repeat protein
MRARLTALTALFVMALTGCGGGSGDGDPTATPDRKGPAVLSQPAPKADQQEAAQDLGFPGFATKNTTRVGGADPVADAAGVALAVYPGAAADSRPQAVSVVDSGDWRSAISAAQLSAAPLRAPVLFSTASKLPAASADALETLKPTGAPRAGDAQVIRVGDAAADPGAGSKPTAVAGTRPAVVARGIDTLQARLRAGKRSRQVIVASSGRPAFAMPAAGLAARSGAPVLWTSRDAVPPATVAAIRARSAPRIYVVGPESAVSAKVVKRLEALGRVKRIAGEDPVSNAIAVARFADGSFGWNVVDPGHGLLFASQARTSDAAAAAPLSAAGTFGPLLLVSDAGSLPAAVQSYLLDIQPGYDKDPVRGVYNHGWILGDEDAVSGPVQARIDSLLEIQPVDPNQ